ncbi:DUF5124 domain-containing protein [Sunxiuqinia indica]|uniref:DUF5124 domain-containing protein n=1 Tax=Sunxiuqinia indica TaxID=2692584 RepID=UPI00135C6CFD|nr:DUF5124 domain-containing protein [Sunxiuqinia indica]
MNKLFQYLVRGRVIMLPMLFAFFLIACEGTGGLAEDPYAGGKEPLGIKLLDEPPVPDSGIPGTEVVFRAKGLSKYSNPATGEYKFEFFINDEKTEIINATDTTLTVLIPANISSGASFLEMEGQIFFGPRFTVLGNVSIDENYGIKEGASGPIYDCLSHSNGGFYIVGNFSYIDNSIENNEAYNSIAVLTNQGNVVKKSANYNTDGALGSLNSISQFSDGRLLVSGNIVRYDQTSGIGNIAIIKSDCSLVTEDIELLRQNGESTVRTFSSFNGGAEDASILKSFVTSNDDVIAIGNMKQYRRADYANSTYSYIKYDITEVNSVMKMSIDGNLDLTYHNGENASGSNGIVSDAYLDGSDGVIIAGDFTAFDGMPTGNIVRLNSDGEVDQDYLANIGTGANGAINVIRYNKAMDKTMVTGNFTEFNGFSCSGVVMLNGDGTVDDNFKLKQISGGAVNFATMLNSGKIVLSGTFEKYDEITRSGILILEASGDVEQDFNVPGNFSGQLYNVFETSSTEGYYALLLVGNFNRFDDQIVRNIVKIRVMDVE